MKLGKHGNPSKRSIRLLPILAALGFVSALPSGWLISPLLAQTSSAASINQPTSGTRALEIEDAAFEVKHFKVEGNTLFNARPPG